jgi:integrase
MGQRARRHEDGGSTQPRKRINFDATEKKRATMSNTTKRGLGEVKLRGRIWWIRYYHNGRRYQDSSGSTKQGDAVDLLKQRIKEIGQGKHVSPDKSRMRFEPAAAMVEDDYRSNKRRSLEDVKRRIKLHLTPFFSGRRLSAITKDEVLKYIVSRQNADAQNATINRELAILKRAYTLAEITRPTFRLLREDNIRQGFFEREQIDSVLRQLPNDLQPVIKFAYITGWRVNSEVLPLQWRQVDLNAGEVRLDPGTTKNREGRTFPLTDDLRDLLETQQAVSNQLKARGVICRLVFHRNGQPIKSFRKAWTDACRRAGCPGRLVHDLRRTAVRNLVRAGVPQSVAMKMTGHLTDSVFRRYDIASPDDLRVAAERLNALMARPKAKQANSSAG